MLYIREIVNNIIAGKETIMHHFNGNEATKFRKQMQEIIKYRITKPEKTKMTNDETIKTNKEKGIDTDKKISREKEKAV